MLFNLFKKKKKKTEFQTISVEVFNQRVAEWQAAHPEYNDKGPDPYEYFGTDPNGGVDKAWRDNPARRALPFEGMPYAEL